jgi:hypothetical protein
MTREECLAKADEMDKRAAEARDKILRNSYLEIAAGWRTLAAQSVIDDNLVPPSPSGE